MKELIDLLYEYDRYAVSSDSASVYQHHEDVKKRIKAHLKDSLFMCNVTRNRLQAMIEDLSTIEKQLSNE